MRYQFKHGLDAPERTLEHREVLNGKPFLRSLYREWYAVFQEHDAALPPGKRVELGSGGGFLKEVMPHVTTSDVMPLPCNDMAFSALEMPFADGELSGIYMIDTFHHLPDTDQFLAEAARTLVPGGRVVMVEPANSTWGRFIYRNFHHEAFEPTGGHQLESEGPMSSANGALPWIVFVRDAAQLEARFPQLRIRTVEYHTPLRYLASGGMTLKLSPPQFTFPIATAVDRALSKLHPGASMFMTVVLEKV